MKQFVISIFALFMVLEASAQQTIEHQMYDRGKGYVTYFFQAENLQGSQFLKDNWTYGEAIAKNGVIFKNVRFKFDTYNNKFIFNLHDTSFEIGPEIVCVHLYPKREDTSKQLIFKNGYYISAHLGGDKFFQVLAEGNISLLKLYQKDAEEFTEYGNATKFKRLRDSETFYLLEKGGRSNPIVLNRKNLETFLEPKWKQLEPFLKQNNISGKDEAGWASAIAYYNSL